MNHRTLEVENDAIPNGLLDLDMEPLVEQIWNDLQGAVQRSTIQRELGEVIPAFASARIKTYVPIFVRRNTVRRLRAGLVVGSLEPKH